MAMKTLDRLTGINELSAKIKFLRSKLATEQDDGTRYRLSVEIADMSERFNELWGAMILGARGELLGKDK